MKIVFIACVEIGLKCLKQVIKDGWRIDAIFTLAKKYASSTSGYVDFTPIARVKNIPLFKVRDINSTSCIKRIKCINPDLIIVCGWQRLIVPEILKIPEKGVVGFHSSLLPLYRGRAPVNWAIIMGEKKTGITIFFCQPQADTGDIIAQKSFPITLRDTCGTIYDKAAKAACILLHKYLKKIESGRVKRKKNTSANFRCWPKRSPRDGKIDWNKPHMDIYNLIRGVTHPYPGAFTFLKKRKVFIWESRLSSVKSKCKIHPPGKIIKTRFYNGQLRFLVATKDAQLWITRATDQSLKPLRRLSEEEILV